MSTSTKNKLIVITGPTASGKTRLAIEVAKELKTEIVSFDSRQFYKEISIGTAKPTVEELEEVPHHFIGHISVQDAYNAGQYETDAIKKLDELFKKYETVVFTGGSGMYLDAVLSGFDALPKVDATIREKLQKQWEKEGLESLQELLKKLDPEYFQQVDLYNPHRLMRALEICLSTGIPYSAQRKSEKKERNFLPVLFGIDVEREILYKRINNRVMEMMQKGLEEEARSVEHLSHLNALQTVGYKELFDYFKGETDLETAIQLIQQNTRRYAKRQMTWLRKYEDMMWLKPEELIKNVKLKMQNG
jgi:tRNA dimethylallyltransferase